MEVEEWLYVQDWEGEGHWRDVQLFIADDEVHDAWADHRVPGVEVAGDEGEEDGGG